jgi:hypothetical protein
MSTKTRGDEAAFILHAAANQPSVGIIVGAVVGGLAGLALIAGAGFLWYKQTHKSSPEPGATAAVQPSGATGHPYAVTPPAAGAGALAPPPSATAPSPPAAFAVMPAAAAISAQAAPAIEQMQVVQPAPGSGAWTPGPAAQGGATTIVFAPDGGGSLRTMNSRNRSGRSGNPSAGGAGQV